MSCSSLLGFRPVCWWHSVPCQNCAVRTDSSNNEGTRPAPGALDLLWLGFGACDYLPARCISRNTVFCLFCCWVLNFSTFNSFLKLKYFLCMSGAMSVLYYVVWSIQGIKCSYLYFMCNYISFMFRYKVFAGVDLGGYITVYFLDTGSIYQMPYLLLTEIVFLNSAFGIWLPGFKSEFHLLPTETRTQRTLNAALK